MKKWMQATVLTLSLTMTSCQGRFFYVTTGEPSLRY